MACHLRRCARGLIPSRRRDVDRSHRGEDVCAVAYREAETSPAPTPRTASHSHPRSCRSGSMRSTRTGATTAVFQPDRHLIDPLNFSPSPTCNDIQYLRPTAHHARPASVPRGRTAAGGQRRRSSTARPGGTVFVVHCTSRLHLAASNAVSKAGRPTAGLLRCPHPPTLLAAGWRGAMPGHVH